MSWRTTRNNSFVCEHRDNCHSETSRTCNQMATVQRNPFTTRRLASNFLCSRHYEQLPQFDLEG